MSYNFHRWHQPATGRYNKPDPYLAGPVDLDLIEEGHQPLFAYTGNRPTVLVDPLGLLALGPGTDRENFNDIIKGLQDLANNCTCARFLADLGVDLPTVIAGVPPFLNTFPTPTIYNPRKRSGFFDCEKDPDNVHIPQKFCNRPFLFPNRRVRKATIAVIHELAHYTDCNGNNNHTLEKRAKVRKSRLFRQSPQRRRELRIAFFDVIYHLAILLGLGLSVGCGSTGPRLPLGEQALEVTLLESGPPTGFLVRITNSAQEPVAVCPCIGPPHRFVVLEMFYYDENRKVGLPEVDYMDAGARRFFRCLDPGESVSVPVDLRRWEPVWNEQRESFPPFNLLVAPGSYRVRALYLDSGNVSRRRCSGFRGRVTSEWVPFESRE